jgi:hypothetical protein
MLTAFAAPYLPLPVYEPYLMRQILPFAIVCANAVMCSAAVPSASLRASVSALSAASMLANAALKSCILIGSALTHCGSL